jgi:uncharacterized protein YyaL (SSP411 family)
VAESMQGGCMMAFTLQQQSQHAYTGYAAETANRVAKYQWDSSGLGYFTLLTRNWTTVLDSHKELTFKYWTLAWLWLYQRTGNQTYLNYAKAYTDVLVDKGWQDGFYDTYDSSWKNATATNDRECINICYT